MSSSDTNCLVIFFPTNLENFKCSATSTCDAFAKIENFLNERNSYLKLSEVRAIFLNEERVW